MLLEEREVPVGAERGDAYRAVRRQLVGLQPREDDAAKQVEERAPDVKVLAARFRDGSIRRRRGLPRVTMW